MKRWFVTLLVIAGCSVSGEPGSGTAATEPRQLAAFTEIEISGAMNAEIAIAETQSVEVRGDDNLVPLVSTTVENGRLIVRTTKPVRPRAGLAVHVTVPRLSALAIAGASTAHLRDVRGDALAVRISGAATIAATGTVRELSLDLTGAGDVDAKDLAAETARVAVTGAGDVDVRASKVLDVRISGAASVRYHGDPAEIRKDISGVGKLEKK
jgi:CO/xanthine dehydrogenase FAD-binding subunit